MIETAIVFGLFGLIIGSFLNVLVLRHGIKSILGRSGCLSCKHELHALDLVPIVSWLYLRGKCRHCGSRISLQYPLVEAATAIFFVAIGGAPLLLILKLFALPIAATLIAISAYDIRHTIIPDTWAIFFAVYSFVFSLSYLASIGQLDSWSSLAIAGPVAALPFALIWYVSKGTWMGLGDAKLAWGIGWLLGPLYAYIAIVFGFLIGAAVSILILLPLSSPLFWRSVRRFTPIHVSPCGRWGFTMKSEVAFGPFLALSCAIVWILIFYHLDVARYFHLA